MAVKVRIVKLAGKLAKASAHLRYVERDGVGRDGQRGKLYSTFTDDVDGEAFVERQRDDRHQFRVIVSPEDGKEFEDLHPFTRDLMAAMERDLGTTLDWVAVDHHDTGHPHTHIVIRGRCEDGKILNIAGDYIAHGIRHRASEIMTRALGPQTELEVADQLTREVDAERFTRLDRALFERATAGVLDARLAGDDPVLQQLLVGRARVLESMRLAVRRDALVWHIAEDAKTRLIEMGRRGDIIRSMHHAMTQAGVSRRPELYQIVGRGEISEPVIGRLVRFGASDEFHDRRFVLVDAIDGRTHYVDIGESRAYLRVGAVVELRPRIGEAKAIDRTVAEIASAHDGRYSIDNHLAWDATASQDFAESHVRRLEALRRAGAAVEREPDGTWRIPGDHLDHVEAAEKRRVRHAPVVIEHRSLESIERVVVQNGPTMLDTELLKESPTDSVDYGFGKDWRVALQRRQQWLIEQGLANVGDGGSMVVRADLLQRLRVREMAGLAEDLASQLGLPYHAAALGDRISGRLLREVQAGSNRYALIERSRDFTLVPWREVLDKHLGTAVEGIVRPNGITWSFGRQRSGPTIS